MLRIVYLVLFVLVATLTACVDFQDLPTDGPGLPNDTNEECKAFEHGSKGCPCSTGKCAVGLECISNVCVRVESDTVNEPLSPTEDDDDNTDEPTTDEPTDDSDVDHDDTDEPTDDSDDDYDDADESTSEDESEETDEPAVAPDDESICGDSSCDSDETQTSCCEDCGCPENYVCETGTCLCVMDCSGIECGRDRCGNTCGSCDTDESCEQGRCVSNSEPDSEPESDDELDNESDNESDDESDYASDSADSEEYCEQFECPDGRCINDSWVCDGEEDCNDGSDEEDCDTDSYSNSDSDPCEEFECGDGRCIDDSRVCDGDEDCNDGSDEDNCEVDVTFQAIDQCNDGFRVDLRAFDRDDASIIPNANESYYTPGYGVPSYIDTKCNNGHYYCLGAWSGIITWGIGPNGNISADISWCFICVPEGVYSFGFIC